MIRAEYKDKPRIVEILTSSFNNNKSVNYIIKQDKNRIRRIKNLMGYSFEICHMFGDVFLSYDRKGCALILLPDKKKTNLKSVLLDLKLMISCLGLSNIKKAIDREARIKELHPKEPMYYLWFIGVDPKDQGKGIGSALLDEVMRHGTLKNRSVYLETSTLRNIPWYENCGFKIYNELDLGYKLFFLRNNQIN